MTRQMGLLERGNLFFLSVLRGGSFFAKGNPFQRTALIALGLLSIDGRVFAILKRAPSPGG